MTNLVYKPLAVLLIEDNRDDEKLALRALRKCELPLVVKVARDGESALQSLGLEESDAETPRWIPDLVISDLKMPKYNGDEVVARFRADEQLRHVPYVIFSSSDDSADVNRCIASGANAYYTKPVAFDEYVECAAGIARRWLTPTVVDDEPECAMADPKGT